MEHLIRIEFLEEMMIDATTVFNERDKLFLEVGEIGPRVQVRKDTLPERLVFWLMCHGYPLSKLHLVSL